MQALTETSTIPYLCPVCGGPLQPQPTDKGYVCPLNHCFDRAKEGYLNLLPVQFKHSKEPGDNKLMLQARREFLEAGFYEPMAKAVAIMMTAFAQQGLTQNVLDLGCGEGYYSRRMADFCQHNPGMVLHGLDIAKFAVAAAAKKQRLAHFIVASANRLPYPDQYFDLVFRVFAPSDDGELKRVLKPSGHLLTVTPGPRHLWQLKELIYAKPKEHDLESELPLGFERLSTQRISYTINPNAQQRMALLQMTPFAWQANESAQQAINAVAELAIETDFILTLAINQA